jgi:hypothetical protein
MYNTTLWHISMTENTFLTITEYTFFIFNENSNAIIWWILHKVSVPFVTTIQHSMAVEIVLSSFILIPGSVIVWLLEALIIYPLYNSVCIK